MIHLIYGSDGYRVRAALAAIQASLRTDAQMLETNTTRLDGAQVTHEELFAHVTAMPFLGEDRLVIVDGLLRAIGGGTPGRRKKQAEADDPLTPWRNLAASLGDPAVMPESTTLVLVEADLPRGNAAFPIFAPIARSQELKPLDNAELTAWVKQQAKRRDLQLTDAGLSAVIQMVGPDLWAMDNELDKLAAYAAGEPCDESSVAALVANAQETKFWTLTDAVVGGDERVALTTLRRLLVEGDAPQRLSFMIAAEYRRIAIVKDMLDRREPRGAIARAVNSQSAFVVDKAVRNAGRFGWPQIQRAYQLLLDADLSVKRGLQDDESALQLLIHELCAVSLRPASRASYAR